RSDCSLHFVRCTLGEARLGVLANISVRPSVEASLLDTDEIIGWQLVTKTVALLHQRIKVAAFRIECERCRITRAGRKRCLIGAVRIETLDGCFRLRFDP